MKKSFKLSMIAAATAAAMSFGSTAFAEITIATAGPMTGQYASFGQQMKAGAEQAVADINAAGGVMGEKLVLEVGDDACDPKQAVAVANQMVNKGVNKPIVPTNSTDPKTIIMSARSAVTLSRIKSGIPSIYDHSNAPLRHA